MTKVLVSPDDHVGAGQVLAIIEVEGLAEDMGAADAKVSSANAALSADRERLAKSQRDRDSRVMLARKGYASQAAVDASRSDVKLAEAEVARGEADLAEARFAARAARARGGQIFLKAPRAGTILALQAQPGQQVGPGNVKPLFIVADDLSNMQLGASVAEPDIGRIRKGMTVRFTVDAYPDRQFAGQVRTALKAPVEDRRLVSYMVLADVSNPEGLLLPGMTAAVEFVRADAQKVLRIPARALYFLPADYRPVLPPALVARLGPRAATVDEAFLDGAEMGSLISRGQSRLFVLEGGRPVRRVVRLGAESNDYVEIRDGLRAGEEVVVRDRKPQ